MINDNHGANRTMSYSTTHQKAHTHMYALQMAHVWGHLRKIVARVELNSGTNAWNEIYVVVTKLQKK